MRSTRRVLQRNRNLSVLYKKTRSNYLQTNRTAMGTKMAGAFANIFMPGKNKKENTQTKHYTHLMEKIFLCTEAPNRVKETTAPVTQ